MPKETVLILLDKAELSVRIIEALGNVKRPYPDPKRVLQVTDDDTREGAMRCAQAAIEYFMECAVDAAGAENVQDHGTLQ